MSLTVKEVIKKSPAKKAGVKAGDIVHKFDNIDMHDFIDDTYVLSIENPSIYIERKAKEKVFKLKKDIGEDAGIIYEENLYPEDVQCLNGCLFCFVDQLPDGMRKSLYVKDDDWRYSVLYGNYITMTNMSEEDFNRVVTRRVSPLYISVHATDPEVRFQLMRNKRSKLIGEQLQFLYDNKITFHSQIVLCPGINDKNVMEQTIKDVAKYYPYAKTLSIVPVGLTGHRNNLPELTPVDETIAKEVIETVENYRVILKEEIEDPFVYASDEFYSKAKMDYPRYAEGEINAQKANGVGLFSDFLTEIDEVLKNLTIKEAPKKDIILVTGVSAYQKIKECADKIAKKFSGINISTIKAENKTFGKSITVAGLLTGYDIIEAVGKNKADTVFVPESSLRNDENIFLDDMTLEELEDKLGIEVKISPNDGYDFVNALIGGNL